jgi:hypothetical protein
MRKSQTSKTLKTLVVGLIRKMKEVLEIFVKGTWAHSM